MEEVIRKLGFKKINNSMWRFGNHTLQNCHTSKGAKTEIEKILSLNKGYKLCFEGKFVDVVTTEKELVKLLPLTSIVEISGEKVDISTLEGAQKYLDSEGVDTKGLADKGMKELVERKRLHDVPKCGYCGRTEICEGAYPEGCFLQNDRLAITKL